MIAATRYSKMWPRPPVDFGDAGCFLTTRRSVGSIALPGRCAQLMDSANSPSACQRPRVLFLTACHYGAMEGISDRECVPAASRATRP
jgi:hypothetical protein